MKKILFFTIISITLSLNMAAQQDAHYTQFMYNKLYVNPAYAGARGFMSATALYRNQWIGLDGAPKSQLLSFDMPIFSDKGGLGLTMFHNSAGIIDTWNMSLAYSYKLKINENNALLLGVQASLRRLQVDFTDPRLVAIDDDDPSIIVDDNTDSNGNFGGGLFYYSKHFFLGASVPNINDNIIGFNDNRINTAKESPHFYFMGGGMFYVDKKIHLKPSLLIKYVKNAPIDFDLNMSFVYDYKIAAGLSYRYGGVTSNFGESIDLTMLYQATKQLGIGASYDIPLSKLGGIDLDNNKKINAGTIEIMLRYDIKSKKGKEKDALPIEIEDTRRFL